MRFGLGGSLSKRGGMMPPRLLRICLRLAMEEANVLGQYVMQMVDADRVVDPVGSMWNEVRVDRSGRRAIFPTQVSVVAGDVCGPGHCLQNEVRVDRSCRRAMS